MYRKKFRNDIYITLSKSQFALFLLSSLALAAALFFIGFTLGRGYLGEGGAPRMAQVDAPAPRAAPAEKAEPEPAKTAAQAIESRSESASAPGAVSEREYTFFKSLPETTSAGGAVDVARPEPAKPAEKRADAAGAAKSKTPTKESGAPVSSKAGLTIQVAAFKEKAMADALSEKLGKKGYRVHLDVSKEEGKEIWHKVKVGDFKTEREAQIILMKIRAEEGLKGFIVKK